MVLFYSLGAILLMSMCIYYFIWKNNLNDKMNLEKDWQKFLKSESINDTIGINQIGDRLIRNKYLLNEQLDKIIHVANTRILDYPELKKLANDAYNKKLHYQRIFPSPGSSGGKKQSW